MRKSSPQSSRDNNKGSDSSFDNNGPRRESKPFKKKNYDGRGPGSSDDKPSRSSKPYSGRTSDGQSAARPASGRKASYDKPFDKEGRPPRKEFDKPRREGGDKPFSDRPKRSFDKPSFKRDDRSEGSGDRKPRKEFDKPRREGGDKPFSDRPKRSFDKPTFKRDDRADGPDDRKPRKEFDKPRSESGDKPFSDRPKRSFDKPSFNKDDRARGDADGKPRKEYNKPGRENGDKPFSDRPKRSYDKPSFKKDDRPRDGADRKPRREFDKPVNEEGDGIPFSEHSKRLFDKPSRKNEDGTESRDMKPKKSGGDTRPFRDRPKKPEDVVTFSKDIDDREPGEENDDQETKEVKSYNNTRRQIEKKQTTKSGKKKHFHDHSHDDEDDEEFEDDKEINQTNGPRLEMPLNKFIAHSGECSRRDAAEMVKQGKVKVNGELVLDPGYRVKHDDKVTLSGKKLTPQKGMVYILLNKPKGFITTNDDPQGRKTVMQLVGNSGVDRLFPVGRLDKDTSGLLLITNDGDLTQKLCHPTYNIKKVYHVTLDKPLTKADFEKVIAGIELEDGIAKVDEIAYLEKKNEIGLEIHSGRNRIVRRIFESMGYVVDKLDRVMYAGLTKKNLPRSKWRYLDEREVVLLKHFKS